MNKRITIKLIYPPSSLYQRGEDRCQSNIAASTATSIRACNDLGYSASVLRQAGYKTDIKDYQTEGKNEEDLLADLQKNTPDVIFLSTTNTTIFDDLKIVNKIKQRFPQIIFILKGAIFFNAEDNLLQQLDLSSVDYLIGTEAEFVIVDIIKAHFGNKKNLSNIPQILYKDGNIWRHNDFSRWLDDLDSLPFPARDLMNNNLYCRPDTQEPQATIAVSRGCPSSCIFCLTPCISGKKLRKRSPQNVLDELMECYNIYHISNFFFKADTFTMDKQWTLELCRLIETSPLKGKISWVANSRVNPIDEETLLAMKKAGCWLVAFGFESGSSRSLKLMQKGTTVEQNINAARMAHKAGLKVYGFYLIGFPWEEAKDLQQTADMIYKINADFIEVHLATPFYGTKLYQLVCQENLAVNSVLGKDYFEAPSVGTKYVSLDELKKFRAGLLLKYHLRPCYIISKLKDAIFKPQILLNYIKFGWRLIRNCLRS